MPANTLFPQQEKMKWDSVTGNNNMPANLRLPYYQNYLQFHFTQTNIGNREAIWYRYLLQGEDKKWSDKTSNTFSRNYLNLSPGNYIFKVSSIYRGEWDSPSIFRFTILPPWWQTGWAYVMDFLIISGLAWAFARYRSRKLKRENVLLENKITRRTAQLQQSLEDLKTTQTQLIQSEKMASLGELTAGIAHEIQNPLNFVNNFSEVNLEMNRELREKIEKLEISAKEKSDIDELMTNIEQNEKKINHHGKRADAIVKGMLQHSRSSNGLKEATDFNALADEYLRLSYHGLRAKDKKFNVNLVTRFDDHIGKINIVPQDFGRVLLNLYNNAMYSVGEKKKQLNGDYEPTITVTTKKQNGKVEMIIADNGIGIPKKVLDKIFQPFFTTKPTGEGTGLGLSLSYDIIKAHDGEISVHTKDGEGAEFIITLHPPEYN
jgi:signal transduction histidine kinase